MQKYILGIDTSCDDTSAAVVSGNEVLANIMSSQVNLHKSYGGVFPTIAKLEHKKNIVPVVNLALRRAGVKLENIDAIAVTVGPGLAPALEVGIEYAKKLARDFSKPLIAVNHIEAHALSALLKSRAKNDKHGAQNNGQKNEQQKELAVLENALAVVISGGHSEFIEVKKIGDYKIIGQTLDDAAGECLDKIGRMLGLGYPAAPIVEQLAKDGEVLKYPFPLPLTTVHDFNLSFSGLKTHAFNLIKKLSSENNENSKNKVATNEKNAAEFNLTRQQICDFCASAQHGVVKHIVYKLDKLLAQKSSVTTEKNCALPHSILLGGGVAANIYLRSELRKLCKKWSKITGTEIKLLTPYTKKLCGDNAAMIAQVGGYKLLRGETVSNLESLDRQPNLHL